MRIHWLQRDSPFDSWPVYGMCFLKQQALEELGDPLSWPPAGGWCSKTEIETRGENDELRQFFAGCAARFRAARVSLRCFRPIGPRFDIGLRQRSFRGRGSQGPGYRQE